MFLNPGRRTAIVEEATGDLEKFFSYFEGSGEFDNWSAANGEACALHHAFPKCSDLLEFTKKLFEFLDGNTPMAPLDAPNVVQIRAFLKALHKFLERLASADEDLPEFYGTSRIMDFGIFVLNSLGRKLYWTNASTGAKSTNGHSLRGFPKDDFVSWTIVMDKSNIHIIYDKKRMLENQGVARPIFLVQQIFERVLLHEIGHGRLHHSYFEMFQPGQTSKPFHETEAWLYALIIRTLVIATRARIDRYLGQSDSAYPL